MAGAYETNTLQYNPDLCIGCELCVHVCPHAVFAMNGRLVRLLDASACMECGACQVNCPTGAITVDSGVGCAWAMIRAALTRQEEPSCGDDSPSSCCSPSD